MIMMACNSTTTCAVTSDLEYVDHTFVGSDWGYADQNTFVGSDWGYADQNTFVGSYVDQNTYVETDTVYTGSGFGKLKKPKGLFKMDPKFWADKKGKKGFVRLPAPKPQDQAPDVGSQAGYASSQAGYASSHAGYASSHAGYASSHAAPDDTQHIDDESGKWGAYEWSVYIALPSIVVIGGIAGVVTWACCKNSEGADDL